MKRICDRELLYIHKSQMKKYIKVALFARTHLSWKVSPFDLKFMVLFNSGSSAGKNEPELNISFIYGCPTAFFTVYYRPWSILLGPIIFLIKKLSPKKYRCFCRNEPELNISFFLNFLGWNLYSSNSMHKNTPKKWSEVLLQSKNHF